MAEDGLDDGRAGEVESVDDDGEKDSEQVRLRTSHGAVGSSVPGARRGTLRPQVEAGCLLWDLAADPAMSEVMHSNHIVSVISTVLSQDHATRLYEVRLPTPHGPTAWM
jgi:hypothetical protein